jgi:hypothetical protein
MSSMARTAPLPPTDFSPKPRCDKPTYGALEVLAGPSGGHVTQAVHAERYNSKAHVSSPWRAGRPIRWACNLSGARGTCATMSPVAEGSIAVTLWD